MGCCARAENGVAAAIPPSSVMNSRRFIIGIVPLASAWPVREAARRRGQRHEGGDRRHEAGKEHRERDVFVEEGCALLDQLWIIGERPGAQNLALAAVADPEGEAVAKKRPGNRGSKDALEAQ